MVQIWSTTPQSQNGTLSPADFCDLREQNTVFAHLSVCNVGYFNSLAAVGHSPEQSIAMAVTADFFPVLGISAALGRTFTPEDQAKQALVVVLSNTYWQKHMASDPNVLGRSLRFDGKTVTVVGVMPPVLDDPLLWNGRIDLWYVDFVEINRQLRDRTWYSVIARLKPGITLGQAQTEVRTIAARLAHDFPKTNDQRGLRVAPFAPDYQGDLGRTLNWMVMALSLLVLVIACVNLTNLQFVRSTGRSREYAIRLALGASRGRLIRLLLNESLLLSLAGGAFGLLIAKWGNSYYAAYFDAPMPLDRRVLAFAFAVSLLTGVVSGVIPAWFGSRADLNAALKQGGRNATADRSRHRLRHGLIVAELALALTLLTGAGFFIRGIQWIMRRELHWRPENTLVGYFELPYERYGDETDRRLQVITDRFLGALRLLPGVDHAAISSNSPVWAYGGRMNLLVEGQSPPPKGNAPVARHISITGDFFDTVGIRLLQGRNFTDLDRPDAPGVVIINQAMAEKFWPGQNPIGKRIGEADSTEPRWYEVVGIVNDIVAGLDFDGEHSRYQFYRPWTQRSIRFITFSLHSVSDPRTLTDRVRQTLAGIEPDIAITDLTTAEQAMQNNLSGYAFVRRTLAQLAGLGLLLSAVGVYGVIANLTVERTHEIGVRMALGAQRGDVVRLFLRNGVTLALIGAAIGLLLSFALVRVLIHTVAIIPGNDPWNIMVLAAALVAVAVLACWLPARRATKVNPLVALRAE
jgi:predicted permease